MHIGPHNVCAAERQKTFMYKTANLFATPIIITFLRLFLTAHLMFIDTQRLTKKYVSIHEIPRCLQ